MALVLFIGSTTWSLVGALRAPGDDVPTKLAEWARAHSLGPVVTAAETVQYRLSPPATGGTPDAQVLAEGAVAARSSATTTPTPTQIQRHARLVGPVVPALAGEGVFVPAIATDKGPLVQVTYVRPDAVHTSYLAGIVWMSHAMRFVLHPGYLDPGTNGMSQPSMITRSEYPKLAVTFNGGFKLRDAGGGYYDHGTTIGTLTDGAASFVVYRDGHATVGAWGAGVSMTPDVAFVRQNLKPLIENGVVVRNLDSNVQGDWGVTVGGGYAVWRSGLGVTPTGDLVYVAGDALSVSALADLLHRAGAVTAMELDINKAWVSFMTYRPGSVPTPKKLVAFQRPVDRYLSDVSRDFVAGYAP